MEMSSSPLSLPAEHRGLYLHIPFCRRKCRYCDFVSQPLARDPALPDRYLDALAREAANRRDEGGGPLHSIYIGGGTPTMLSGRQLWRLWDEIIAPFPRLPDAEVSLEANPGTLTDDVLATLAALPLTRVSLGAQSLHDAELAMLGRMHTAAEVATAMAALRSIGVPQVNLDLIYGLPGQTAADWQETLARALALAPDHLSLYALIVEEGTPFATLQAAGQLPLPGEDEEDAMARLADEMLAGAGFARYEVANAAPAGAHCRHNLGYWLGRDYLGLGAAAASAAGALRWRNRDDAAGYCDVIETGCLPVTYAERLARRARLLERVMLGLRLRDGFDLAAAETACGCRLAEIAPAAVEQLQRDGLLEIDGARCRLSAAGYPLANAVVRRLMA